LHYRFRYSWRRLIGDLSGGAIAALIAFPYGLSMASMMGLPPVLGLVTSISTAPVTALLGRNPVLIGGAASATVPFIAQAVHLQGPGGAAKVCMAASVFMMMFCVLKLGRYIQPVPHAVVTGFSCGIGAMMILSQLGVLFGCAP
jgi:sulfate permease, SulP family